MSSFQIALQPKQILFKDSVMNYQVTLFGGARGGGKSYALRNIFLLLGFLYPKSASAIFRKTYPELEANHIRPLFNEFPALREYYNESKKILALPNKSTLQFSYCESSKDLARQQGNEIHFLGIDEAGGWLESDFRTLLGSNRSSDRNIPVRCALTANPGGIGHQWLKRIFIEKRYNENETPSDYNFIQSLVQDNKALVDADPGYVSRLNSETNENLRRAFLYGDWDISAGAYFTEIDRSIHFIDPFPIPDHWACSGAYDFGFNHPGTFGWFTSDNDGNIFLYREFVRAGLRVDQFIDELKKFDDTLKLERIIGGLDCWTTKSVIKAGTPPTVAEEFLDSGLVLSRAIVDRIQGANQVRKYLSWKNKNGKDGKPRFYIFKNCPISFECLTRMQIDPDRPEDVLKVDASNGDVSTGDDPYDMIRYYLMSRPYITDTYPGPEIGSKEWAKQEEDRMFNEILERENSKKRDKYAMIEGES